ncbi:MAG: hypothetical protein U1E65_08865 [Myxococcota bacterium]
MTMIKSAATVASLVELHGTLDSVIDTNRQLRFENQSARDALAADRDLAEAALAPLASGLLSAQGLSAEEIQARSPHALFQSLESVAAFLSEKGVNFGALATQLDDIDATAKALKAKERALRRNEDLEYQLTRARDGLFSVERCDEPQYHQPHPRPVLDAVWEGLRNLNIAAGELRGNHQTQLASKIEEAVEQIRAEPRGKSTVGAAVDRLALELSALTRGKAKLSTMFKGPTFVGALGDTLPKVLEEAARRIEKGESDAILPYFDGEKLPALAAAFRTQAKAIEAGEEFHCPNSLNYASGELASALRMLHNANQDLHNSTYTDVLGPETRNSLKQ